MNIMGFAQAKSLLIIASQLSGYPIPADANPPPVELLTQQEMAKDACTNLSIIFGCPIIGYFQFPDFEGGNDGREHIKIVSDEEFKGHSVNAIAVHELTHWLQYHNWPRPDSRECPREFNREFEAYFVGARYEVIYEHKAPPETVSLPGLTCAYQDKT